MTTRTHSVFAIGKASFLTTATLIVLMTSFNGAVAKHESPLAKVHSTPLNYLEFLTDTAKLQTNSHALRYSAFASSLEEFISEFHRFGFQPIIADFVKELNRGKGDSLLQDQAHRSAYSDKIRAIVDLFKASSGYNLSLQCLNDTIRIVQGVDAKETWSIPFLDATGKPGPAVTQFHLNFPGNYDLCRSAVAPIIKGLDGRGFTGNYCVLKASPKIFPTASLQWAVCVPSTCSDKDMDVMAIMALAGANLTSMLTPLPVDCRNDQREFTAATIVAILVLTVIGLLMAGGTLYDLLAVQMPKWVHERKQEMGASGPLLNGAGINVSASEIEPLVSKPAKDVRTKPQSVGVSVLLAFSVYTNGSKVLNTTQATGSLGAIHGIRFLSMAWVILGHMYFFGLPSFENVKEMQVYLSRWTFAAIVNALPSVDTFFTLSGLLTSYLTIKHMKATTWRLNWGLFYFHRFWRLTPPYMLTLVMVLGLTRFLGSGAMWSSVQPSDKQFCEDNWWTNLLYINNFVKPKQMCMEHTWYMANDMQFFLVSPLLMIPFYFNHKVGVAINLLLLLASWVTSGILSTVENWSTTLLSANSGALGGNHWFEGYYIVPWCRVGPYVVGVLGGYLLAVTGGGKEIRMRWWMALLGWLVAIGSGLAIVYGVQGDLSGENPSSVGAAALYNAVARSVWGLCIAWVIIACAAGYGGPINALLSWSPFVFLGKLTYMAYLIHPTVIQSYLQNMEVAYYVTVPSIVISYLGVLVFVNILAFVLMLAFESPWIVLEKIFIRK